MSAEHRIGATRVVTVYRLITRGTLEEKIMGMQRFKLHVAQSIVSSENASLASMGTDQLLHLFNVGDGPAKPEGPGTVGGDDTAAAAAAGGTGRMASLLADMGQLWDAQQYADLNVDSFLQSMSDGSAAS